MEGGPVALSAGTRLGPYEVAELLGAGGMGEVYRARDPRLGRDVAIKVLPDDIAADPNRLRRFEHEAKAVAALNHPHILTVHDVGSHEGTPYVVTELLEGETLREVLTRRSPNQRHWHAAGAGAFRRPIPVVSCAWLSWWWKPPHSDTVQRTALQHEMLG
jgi:serine/threonine protein kinase